MQDVLKGDSVTFLAPAKLNLSLDVKGKLENGYHQMEMIMQTVSIFDEVTVSKTDSFGITIDCDTQVTLRSEENIAYKAAETFFEYCGIKDRNINIKIKKQIPSQAGMGGGSADAAAVIVGLNRLYKQKVPLSTMIAFSKDVGADVPFCMHGGTALVEGIGEKITPINDCPNCFFVVAKPICSISTKEAFENIDKNELIAHPNTQQIIDMIRLNDIEAATADFLNVFEEVTHNAEIEKIKMLMSEFKGLAPIMTGSGSAVFCTYLDEDSAIECYYKISDLGIKTYVCEPVKTGPILKTE